MEKAWKERVAVYVDSPKMKNRIKLKGFIVATIDGTAGTYQVRMNLRTHAGRCNCPYWDPPCKHLHALQETWRRNPESFGDIDDLLKTMLRNRTKADMRSLMASMILESPACLTALGVLGFRDFADWDDPNLGR